MQTYLATAAIEQPSHREIVGHDSRRITFAEGAWAILDQMPCAVLVLGLDRRLRYFNHEAANAYNWISSDALGSDVALLFPHSGDCWEEISSQTLDLGCWTGEIHFETDGCRRVDLSRWKAVRDTAGRTASFLVMNTDITKQKHFEEQLLRTQRLESIGTLAAGVAHDLNNILSPILMAAHLLRSEMKTSGAKEMVEIIEHSGKRALGMLKQLLAFSRGAGNQWGRIDLRNLLQETQQLIQETFPRHVRLELQLPDGETWEVRGNRTELQQVLLNLCINARDAMPQGGQLALAAENMVLDSTYAANRPGARTGAYVLLRVTDTGSGIAPDILQKIFDPFFTTKEAGKGTGLGLSTVFSIVKRHGGFMEVQSEPGQGTEFKVFFPATAPSPAIPRLKGVLSLSGAPAG